MSHLPFFPIVMSCTGPLALIFPSVLTPRSFSPCLNSPTPENVHVFFSCRNTHLSEGLLVVVYLGNDSSSPIGHFGMHWRSLLASCKLQIWACFLLSSILFVSLDHFELPLETLFSFFPPLPFPSFFPYPDAPFPPFSLGDPLPRYAFPRHEEALFLFSFEQRRAPTSPVSEPAPLRPSHLLFKLAPFCFCPLDR